MHILTVIAAVDHAAKVIRKRIVRAAAPVIVNRRNGTATTQAIRSGELVTVGAHLTNLGADDDTRRRYSSHAGKKVRAAFETRTGMEPRRIWTVSAAGYPIEVFAYPATDPALTAGVRAYARTAHLIAA